MAEEAVELGHVDVRDARRAADQDHVLVVRRQRVLREVRRSRANQRIVAQRIDQQILGVHEEDVALVARQFLFEEPAIERERLGLALGDDLAVLHRKLGAEHGPVGDHEIAVALERLPLGRRRRLLLEDEAEEVAVAAERLDEVVGDR